MNSVDALELALACFRDPVVHKKRFVSSAPLPTGMDRLLSLIGRGGSLLEEAASEAGVTPDELRQAICFLIQQLCLAPHATHYRVLGLEPGATIEQIEDHYRSLRSVYHRDHDGQQAAIDLQVLLYPLRLFPADRVDDTGWSDAFEARINRAYSVLSRPRSRAIYDALLQRSELLAAPTALSARQSNSVNEPRGEIASATEMVQPPMPMRPVPLVQEPEVEFTPTVLEEGGGRENERSDQSWMRHLSGHRAGLLLILLGVALLVGLFSFFRHSLEPEGDSPVAVQVKPPTQSVDDDSGEDVKGLEKSDSESIQQGILDKVEIVHSTEKPMEGVEKEGVEKSLVSKPIPLVNEGSATPSPSSDHVSAQLPSPAAESLPTPEQIEKSESNSSGQVAGGRMEPSEMPQEPWANTVSSVPDKPSVSDSTQLAPSPAESGLIPIESPENLTPSVPPPAGGSRAGLRESHAPASGVIEVGEKSQISPPQKDRVRRAGSQRGSVGPRGTAEQRRYTPRNSRTGIDQLAQSKRPSRIRSQPTDGKGLLGRWYEAGFLKRLEATRSPCQSIVGSEMLPRITLRKNGGYLSADVDYGFNDQVSVYLGKTGDKGGTKVVRSEGGGKGPMSNIDKLVWLDGDSPSVTLLRKQGKGKSTLLSYRMLSGRELNRIVFASVYRGTSQDKDISLISEGTFKSPTKSFSFDLGLDCTVATCDYLQANDGSKESDGTPLRYGFSRIKGGLAIFKLRYGGGGQLVCETAPIFMLKEVW